MVRFDPVSPAHSIWAEIGLYRHFHPIKQPFWALIAQLERRKTMDDYVSKVKSKAMDEMFQAILGLENLSECYRFFEDLCTVPELLSLSQRWEVVEQLDRGVTYQDISKTLNVSTATISRVNRCLTYGASGYRLALDRAKAKALEDGTQKEQND